MDREKAIRILTLFREEWDRHSKTPNAKALNMAIEALQEPQVGGVEIDKNFETILLCAVRYAIGRQTYIPSMVIDYITPLLSHLSYNTLGLIAAEIIDHSYDGGLGDDMIDRPYWLAFKKKILAEMERRGNEDTEQMGKESH